MKRNIRRQKDLKSGPQVNLKIESNRDMAGLDAVSWKVQRDEKKKQLRIKQEREAQTEQIKSIRNGGTEKAEQKRKKMP